MSLFSILSNASSALLNSQAQIDVVSSNVGNAQSSNYNRRDTTVVATSTGGARVVSVTRAVDTALQGDYLTQSAASGGASYTDSLYSQLEQLTGSSTGSPTLTADAQSFISAWQSLQASPTVSGVSATVTQTGQTLASAIQSEISGLDSLTQQVQTDLGNDVTTVNSLTTQIASLNTQISSSLTADSTKAGLEDSRDALVTQLAAIVPIKVTANSDGTNTISTVSGVTLATKTALQLSYDSSTNTIYGSGDSNKTSLNGAFTSGRISAELGALATDSASVASTDPSAAPIEKAREQLAAFAAQFTSPSSFNTAVTSNGGASMFTMTAGQAGTFQLNTAATVDATTAAAVVKSLTATGTTLTAANVSGTSILGLANAIATDQSNRASTASTRSTTASTDLQAAQTAYKNSTGVSTDDQLTQLITLQNAYSAAAKVISVVNELQQTLFNTVNG